MSESSPASPNVVYIREVETRFKKKRVKGDLPVHQPLTDPSVVVGLFQTLQNATKEKLIAVAVDAQLKILCFEVVAIGSISAVDAQPGEIIRNTWSLSPSGYILVHNHPSGNPTPSEADRVITAKFAKVLKDLGAQLYDHIIIGEPDTYYSFAESGILT